ncbi:TPA: ead/Ea22-like family protein [Escherichia coli]|uniref:ead/Ea22-like family protein n=1 Tax=Escherichia coli TaxID=562 RepID=UPI001B9F1C9B|nr:ead/Ea22-like family protein [Escherichia coli]HBD0014610.1 ead/Ea22-like family protein [Escherichia coli]HDP9621952.1 ead/Ea22-like family protein [Escherichia coli]HEI2484016.1 ead/Ea22-like family protein [Escherichia coli]
MNKIDYQALREKSEKATCGVWSLEYGESRFDCDDALIHRDVVGYLPICRIEGAHPESGFDEDFKMEQQANAEFIAAANPATVLALLDELEVAEKRIAELESLTVPQLPQQAVPDEMPEPDTARMFFTDAVVAIAKVQGWNACRAAMLHSAEPVSQAYKLNALDGNSPVTPDGWIPVSERMPEPYEYVLVTDGFDGCEVMRVNTDGYWGPAKSLYPGDITHWMPLPTAPQQEVKS